MPHAAALPGRVRLEGARFWTADPAHPWAQSLDIQDGRIAAVDAPARPDTPVITLPGTVVTPGLVDAHLHLTLGAATLLQLDLSAVRSRTAFEAAIHTAHAALPPGAWLCAHGWDEANWGGERPTLAWLRSAADRPTVAYRADQHACLVNSAVLHMLGNTPCPEGGVIESDAAGQPTGMLLEQAAWQLINPRIPQPAPEALRNAVVGACAQANACGVTSVCSMEYAAQAHSVLEWLRAHQPDALSLRVRITLLDRSWPLDFSYGAHFANDELLSVIGYKAFVDGTLGSRTARLLEPYTDTPGHFGLLVEHAAAGDGRLAAWMRAVVERGFSPSVHVIGDAALRVALEAAEQADPARLLRIEHAQTIHAEDLSRLAGRAVSMQPLHKTGDAVIAPSRLGSARMDRFFPFRSVVNAGARLAFGSDWPIVSLDPRPGIRAAITGLDANGQPCCPAQNLTLDEAMHAYTAGAASVLRDPAIGTLGPGAHADLCMWQDDPWTHDWQRSVPRVAATVLGGRMVWSSSSATEVANAWGALRPEPRQESMVTA